MILRYVLYNTIWLCVDQSTCDWYIRISQITGPKECFWSRSFALSDMKLDQADYKAVQDEADPSIFETQLFHNLTWEILGQNQGWGRISRSCNGHSILSIHCPFVPYQLDNSFLCPEINLFQYLALNTQGQSQGLVQVSKSRSPTLHRFMSYSFYANRIIHSWRIAWYLEEDITWCNKSWS